MIFTIHEQIEETNTFKTYSIKLDSLKELMDKIENEWWWARVEMSTTFGNEINLYYDDSNNSDVWNE